MSSFFFFNSRASACVVANFGLRLLYSLFILCMYRIMRYWILQAEDPLSSRSWRWLVLSPNLFSIFFFKLYLFYFSILLTSLRLFRVLVFVSVVLPVAIWHEEENKEERGRLILPLYVFAKRQRKTACALSTATISFRVYTQSALCVAFT